MVNKKENRKTRRVKYNKEKLPKIRFSVVSNNKPFEEALVRSIDVNRTAERFWKEIPRKIRTRLLEHYSHTTKLSLQQRKYFFRDSASLVAEILQEIISEKCPKYSAFNYSVEVYSRRLLRFEVFLHSLETRHTSYGNVYIFPDLRYPSNKRLGVSTHAIQRMDSRVLMAASPIRSLTLRMPLVLIPYKDDIFGLYFAIYDERKRINRKTTPLYLLIGYFPIVECDDLFVGKTMLAPGFEGTPEHGIPEKELADYRSLAAIGEKVYRIPRSSLGSGNIRGVRYNLDHPNISMLCRMNRLVEKL